MTTLPPLGGHVEREMVFTAEVIRAGADHLGDVNPLHHDAVRAAASRFGGLIASGAHTAALLCGLATQAFGAADPTGAGAVGVDFQVRFIAAVRVDRPVRLWWRVAAHEPRRSGTIVGSRAASTTSPPRPRC